MSPDQSQTRAQVRKRGQRGKSRTVGYIVFVVGLLVLFAAVYLYALHPQKKPVILYVNQGNGIVDSSNFEQMLGFTTSHGFNTVFFQVYRSGNLLFTRNELSTFVNETHAQGLKIFFALYFTNSTQSLPNAIMGLGQDGVSLDMSTLNIAAQESLLGQLEHTCQCQAAVTSTDMASPLKPDLLILETYGASTQQFIRQGIIASVGVFAATSQEDYQSQFHYALENSDGVMVFDYAGLLKSGY
jgi:hypothetical protein